MDVQKLAIAVTFIAILAGAFAAVNYRQDMTAAELRRELRGAMKHHLDRYHPVGLGSGGEG